MLYPINVVNKRTFKGDGIYIGRPSILGNRFIAKTRQEVDRQEVISQYKKWLWNNRNQPAIKKELDRLFDLVQKQELNLICWCAPKSCHGDIIKDYLIWRHNNENQHT